MLLHCLRGRSRLGWKGIAVRSEVLIVPFRRQDLWERFESVWELPLVSVTALVTRGIQNPFSLCFSAVDVAREDRAEK